MKILILTQRFNTSLAERVVCLQEAGVEVILVCFELNSYFRSKAFKFFSNPTNFFSKILITIKLFKLIAWCDAIHFYGSNLAVIKICLALQKFHRKKGIIEFKKEDIFIPEIEYLDNELYRDKWFLSDPHTEKLFERSKANQNFFRNHKLVPLAEHASLQYLLFDIFKPPHTATNVIFNFENPPVFSKPDANKIRVAVSKFSDELQSDATFTSLVAKLKEMKTIEVIEVESKRIVDISYYIQNTDCWLGSIYAGQYGYWDWYAIHKSKVVLTPIKKYLLDKYFSEFKFSVTNIDSILSFLEKLSGNPLLLEQVQTWNKTIYESNFGKDKTIKSLTGFYYKTIRG